MSMVCTSLSRCAPAIIPHLVQRGKAPRDYG
jgi:hypothetical protein